MSYLFKNFLARAERSTIVMQSPNICIFIWRMFHKLVPAFIIQDTVRRWSKCRSQLVSNVCSVKLMMLLGTFWKSLHCKQTRGWWQRLVAIRFYRSRINCFNSADSYISGNHLRTIWFISFTTSSTIVKSLNMDDKLAIISRAIIRETSQFAPC